MPALVFQKDLDSIAADLGIGDGSDFAAIAAGVKALKAAFDKAEADNAAHVKESKRLTDGWRETSDKLEDTRKKLAAANEAGSALSDELDEARETIEKHLQEIERWKSANDRAKAAFEDEKAAHAKTRESAASNEQALKANHADAINKEQTQVFNLNQLIAKLNKDAETCKDEYEAALAAQENAKDEMELSYLAKLQAEQERRLRDVTAARAASDAEVAAARELMDKVRAKGQV